MRFRSRLRWWEFVPEGVLAAGLGAFAITETSAATSAFTSSTALALMGLVGVTWLAVRLLLLRVVRWPGLRLGVFVIPALAILSFVVLPAYDDTTVVETLPGVMRRVDDNGASGTQQAPRPAVPTDAADSGPVVLRTSMLEGIDHRASGTAAIYGEVDGTLVVGLENIDIQPGPDYDVYLVRGRDREDPAGGVRLDDLRGNLGTQYYRVPADTDLGIEPWTVLVWCETFDVPVASATPR